MANGNGNGFWRYIAGLFGTIILTGLVSWFSFGAAPSVAQVENMIKTQAPFIEYRREYDQRFRNIESNLSEIKKDINFMKENFWKRKSE